MRIVTLGQLVIVNPFRVYELPVPARAYSATKTISSAVALH